MPVAAIVGAVIGVAGIATSLSGARSAEQRAEEQAEEEARLEGIVTEERLRQMDVEEMVTRGETIAAAAASGVEVSGRQADMDGPVGEKSVMGKGSVVDILAEQAYNYAREREAVSEAGATRAANALSRGAMAAEQARYQGISTALNQAANIALLFRK